MKEEITYKRVKLIVKQILVLVFVLVSIAPKIAWSQTINEAMEPTFENSDVINLLEGETLNAWQPSSEHWYIENKTIIGNTKHKVLDTPEWMYSKQKFSDFEFTCELKLTGDNRRNTGVYFRVNPFIFKQKKGKKSYEAAAGYEYDVAFHNPKKKNMQGTLGDWYARPKLRVFPDEKLIKQFFKPEDWNRLTIRARSNRIEYWLNGVKIIDYLDEDPKAFRNGFLGFQIHDGTVMQVTYRNILIHPLGTKE
ncbi:3-keto-disaccharide hydrolase [Formosa haliotis]|uniref:3-keto-disaccharide hydrolase n=1 Tax=Formosa haliotis TaxID=1555194 RepID=UPI0008270C3F|nr:DUF1080 domain-containing protein [Formosa haliotis]